MRGNIGIENDVAHELRKVLVPSGVHVFEEVFQLIIRVEDTTLGHLLDRFDRAYPLSSGHLIERDRTAMRKLGGPFCATNHRNHLQSVLNAPVRHPWRRVVSQLPGTYGCCEHD